MNPEFGSFWQAIKIEADKSLCQRFDWRRGQMHSWRCYGFRAEHVLLRWENSFVSHFCLFYRFSHLVSLSKLQWQMFVIRRQIYVECRIMQTSAVMNQEIRCVKNVKKSCSLKVCFLSINCPSGHLNCLFFAYKLSKLWKGYLRLVSFSHKENNELLKPSMFSSVLLKHYCCGRIRITWFRFLHKVVTEELDKRKGDCNVRRWHQTLFVFTTAAETICRDYTTQFMEDLKPLQNTNTGVFSFWLIRPLLRTLVKAFLHLTG